MPSVENKNTFYYKKLWLSSILLATLAMILLGAYTRLSGSGLSMVDWRLLAGVLPPIGEQAWEKSFATYQQFPEYQLLRPNMTLSQYKEIFIVEYLHRMLGRVIGLMVAVPFLIFLLRKRLSPHEVKHFSLLFLLVLVQGLVGWYMVKSGLAGTPQVSHYRLGLHLSLALSFLSYTFLLLLSLEKTRKEDPQKPSSHLQKTAQPSMATGRVDNRRGKRFTPYFTTALSLLGIQILLGAFVAGLKAGYITPEYPKMFGKWIPVDNMFGENSTWLQNFFENPIMLNFLHRHFGVLVAAFIACVCTVALFNKQILNTVKVYALLALILAVVQPLVGIATVASGVNMHSALLHQLLACLMLLALLGSWHNSREQKAFRL